MANGQGQATIDFGVGLGSNEASMIVAGQASIGTNSNLEAYVMASDTTADHTAADHTYLGLFANFTCGTIVAGTGFTIYARTIEKLSGTFIVRWVWSD
jgi:hypothetical protein